jgi:DNA processing protein
LVVEGEEDSGSLITAEWALEQGREIFAVPGRVDSALSRGPNRLIQQGAKLVAEAADIMSEFPEHAPTLSKAPRAALAPLQARLPGTGAAAEPLSGEEALIVGALRESGRVPVEGLLQRLGMQPASLSATLTMLEIKGAVRQLPGALVEAL